MRWRRSYTQQGAIYGYDLSLRALQSTEIEFNAPSCLFHPFLFLRLQFPGFSSALAVNKEGDAALLASSHKHSSGTQYTAFTQIKCQ